MAEIKGLVPWSNSEVKMMQCALVLLGYQLNCDGEMGEKTFSELKRYQKERRLEPTGIFDRPTVAKLLNGELRLFPREVASASEVKGFLDDRFGEEANSQKEEG
jgi:hypothetical protein